MNSEAYSGKVNLVVYYQWWEKDFIGESGDEPVFAKTFDNSEKALSVLDKVMPNGYRFDDGYMPDEFESEIKKGETADIYAMYAANLDDTHCVFATIRPILDE